MNAITFIQAVWADGVNDGMGREQGHGYLAWPFTHVGDTDTFRERAVVNIGDVRITFGDADTIIVRHIDVAHAEWRNASRAAGKKLAPQYGAAMETVSGLTVTLPVDATLADLGDAIARVEAARAYRSEYIPDGSVEEYDTRTGAMVGQYWGQQS